MAYFKELNDIVMGIIGEYMLQNQNICKMLYYYPEVKTPNFNPLTQPDIEDTTQLMFKHIFPLPKLPDAATEEKGYITVTLTGGNTTDNKGYRRVNVQFDIIYHLEAWTVKGGFRPYYIANEIDKMFNEKVLTLPIMGKSLYYGFRLKDYSSYYYGINLIYSFFVDSNITCNPFPMSQKIPFLGKVDVFDED